VCTYSELLGARHSVWVSLGIRSLFVYIRLFCRSLFILEVLYTLLCVLCVPIAELVGARYSVWVSLGIRSLFVYICLFCGSLFILEVLYTHYAFCVYL